MEQEYFPKNQSLLQSDGRAARRLIKLFEKWTGFYIRKEVEKADFFIQIERNDKV